jgi:hypothetical protein
MLVSNIIFSRQKVGTVCARFKRFFIPVLSIVGKATYCYTYSIYTNDKSALCKSKEKVITVKLVGTFKKRLPYLDVIS